MCKVFPIADEIGCDLGCSIALDVGDLLGDTAVTVAHGGKKSMYDKEEKQAVMVRVVLTVSKSCQINQKSISEGVALWERPALPEPICGSARRLPCT